MYLSDMLRKKVEEKNNLDLEKYRWSPEMEDYILNINLDDNLEEHVKTMREVFENGYNIGHCGITSRYLVKHIEGAQFYKGRCALMDGTFNAPCGAHAWVCLNGNIIDTTLMTIYPEEFAKQNFGYNGIMLNNNCAKMLSEYDVYELDYQDKKNFPLLYKKERLQLKKRIRK